MFERRIQNQLHEWAEKNNRKPLILRGARQVGKTTIVEQFGKEFDNFLSLNLEKKEAKDLFESTDDVKMLLPLLFLYDNKPQRPGRTLLFIDEIQSSPQAVALLMESLRQTCFQNPIYKPSLSYCLKKLNKGTRMQSHILHPSYRQRDVFVQHIFQKRTCCLYCFCMIISRRGRDEPCFLSTRYSRLHKLLHC